MGVGAIVKSIQIQRSKGRKRSKVRKAGGVVNDSIHTFFFFRMRRLVTYCWNWGKKLFGRVILFLVFFFSSSSFFSLLLFLSPPLIYHFGSFFFRFFSRVASARWPRQAIVNNRAWHADDITGLVWLVGLVGYIFWGGGAKGKEGKGKRNE